MSFLGDNGTSRTQLDPWRVVLACLFELDSHEIPAIIDTAGLTVDWTLTEREDYSHNYRKRAYRPRIVSAYDALDTDDKLRVVYIVSAEMVHRGLADKINAHLGRVGWHIDGESLSPATESVREMFFPHGTQHDAYVRIRNILHRARHTLCIMDPYLDGTILSIIGDTAGSLNIELLATKLASDFALELQKFEQQHSSVQIQARRTSNFHDCFIVIDKTECWHVGCSIKDDGNKAFMLSKIEDPKKAAALLTALRDAWNTAVPV